MEDPAPRTPTEDTVHGKLYPTKDSSKVILVLTTPIRYSVNGSTYLLDQLPLKKGPLIEKYPAIGARWTEKQNVVIPVDFSGKYLQRAIAAEIEICKARIRGAESAALEEATAGLEEHRRESAGPLEVAASTPTASSAPGKEGYDIVAPTTETPAAGKAVDNLAALRALDSPSRLSPSPAAGGEQRTAYKKPAQPTKHSSGWSWSCLYSWIPGLGRG